MHTRSLQEICAIALIRQSTICVPASHREIILGAIPCARCGKRWRENLTLTRTTTLGRDLIERHFDILVCTQCNDTMCSKCGLDTVWRGAIIPCAGCGLPCHNYDCRVCTSAHNAISRNLIRGVIGNVYNIFKHKLGDRVLTCNLVGGATPSIELVLSKIQGCTFEVWKMPLPSLQDKVQALREGSDKWLSCDTIWHIATECHASKAEVWREFDTAFYDAVGTEDAKK